MTSTSETPWTNHLADQPTGLQGSQPEQQGTNHAVNQLKNYQVTNEEKS
jgi:hypothetical protein